MARVVSSKNLLAAAANEGAVLLVKRAKDAGAEAAYKTIGAEAEKKAASGRAEGLALFRTHAQRPPHQRLRCVPGCSAVWR